ncbi:MAG: LAGLIDADG family homing endonuclease [Thaumarchaeota archaeon]|nr:LAGLIDADG family homing endonuclease [Nitrososphaerota archaeon]
MPGKLSKYIGIRGSYAENGFQFLEGFFDAEGCVKVIKERVRKTPKICLDVTNTRVEILQVFNEVMERTLGITGHYSMQSDPRANRKTVFHLRLYRKREIARFLQRINTIKLTDLKRQHVYNWLSL